MSSHDALCPLHLAQELRERRQRPAQAPGTGGGETCLALLKGRSTALMAAANSWGCVPEASTAYSEQNTSATPVLHGSTQAARTDPRDDRTYHEGRKPPCFSCGSASEMVSAVDMIKITHLIKIVWYFLSLCWCTLLSTLKQHQNYAVP